MKETLMRVVWAVTTAVPIYLWASETVTILRINAHTISALFGHLAAVFMVQALFLGSRFKILEKGVGLQRLNRSHGLLGGFALMLLILHGALMAAGNDIGMHPMYTVLPAAGVILISMSALFMLLVKARLMRVSSWLSLHGRFKWVFYLFAAHALYIRGISVADPFSVYYLSLTAMAVCADVATSVSRHHRFSFPHKVTEVIRESHDTWVIRCEKNGFKYLPGQYAFIRTVMNGRVSEEHPFTISSDPTGDYIEFTIKWVGEFTSAVHHLRPGDDIIIDGPYGQFCFLMKKPGDVVFIAGGIGITPFISMLRYANRVSSRHKFTLIWGNKRKEDIIFRAEIKDMTLGLEKMRVVHVLSRDPGRKSEHGHIDSGIISKYVDIPESSIFFICGPPRMAYDLKRILQDMGIDKRRVFYERFGL